MIIVEIIKLRESVAKVESLNNSKLPTHDNILKFHVGMNEESRRSFSAVSDIYRSHFWEIDLGLGSKGQGSFICVYKCHFFFIFW